MPTPGASSFSVLGLPHALWGVRSTPVSPPLLDAKAPARAHHLSQSLKNSCLEPAPKIIRAPTFPLGGILLPTSFGIEEDAADGAPKCCQPPPHTLGPCKAICASGLEPPGLVVPDEMTRTLSLPCVGALGATHSSLPTELSRDQHCSPHRVQQSCLLASKRRKENLKPTHRPSATQRLPWGPRPESPDRHSHSAAPPGTALVPSLHTEESSLTPTHKSAGEPGTGSRFRTPQLGNRNQPQLPPKLKCSGAAADTQST